MVAPPKPQPPGDAEYESPGVCPMCGDAGGNYYPGPPRPMALRYEGQELFAPFGEDHEYAGGYMTALCLNCGYREVLDPKPPT